MMQDQASLIGDHARGVSDVRGFVYDAVRTPFGRYAGALATAVPTISRPMSSAPVGRAPRLDPARVDEVVLGNATALGG